GHPPLASPDLTATPVNTPVYVNAVGNDSDPDGDPLTVSEFTQPDHGTVTAGPGGTLSYTPATGYGGTDTFDYTVSDGYGGTDTVTVTVTVVPSGQPDLPGDDLGSSLPVSLTPGTQTELSGMIGDGLFGEKDVDLYRLQLTAGQQLSADVDAALL